MDIKDLIIRCWRLLKISRKPTNDEFQTVARVTGLGIVLIGLMGMVLTLISTIG